jgi:hypothetical protein
MTRESFLIEVDGLPQKSWHTVCFKVIGLSDLANAMQEKLVCKRLRTESEFRQN